jgi:hypothetical protein
MPVSRRRKAIKPVRTALMPGEISDRCRALVRRITATVAHWGLYCSAEDRAAALLICAFGEIARIKDRFVREDFLAGMWAAHDEMVQRCASSKN